MTVAESQSVGQGGQGGVFAQTGKLDWRSRVLAGPSLGAAMTWDAHLCFRLSILESQLAREGL